MDKDTDSTLEILSRIVEVSNSNIIIEDRLKFVCDIISREMDLDCVTIYKLPPRSLFLEPWVSSCISIEESSGQKFRVKLGEGVSGIAAWKRQPFFVENLKKIPQGVSLVPPETEGFSSIYSVPIKDDVYLYGSMNLSSVKVRKFTNWEKSLLKTVSVEVAGTIRNARLYLDARKRVSELLTLNEIGRAITSSFRLNDIITFVARTSLRVAGADGCSIWLYDFKKRSFGLHVEEGFIEKGVDREPQKIGKKIVENIVRERKPILVNTPADSHFYKELRGKDVSSYLGVPVISKGKPLGVMSFYRFSKEDGFDHESLNLIQTISTLLGNVIENVRMFSEASDLASKNQMKVRQFKTLYNVARALMSTIKTERLLNVMMDHLTSPSGFDYSRAILLLLSEDGLCLEPKVALGPVKKSDARKMDKLFKRVEKSGQGKEELDRIREKLWKQIENLKVFLNVEDRCIVSKAVLEGKPVNCTGGCGKVLRNPESFCSIHSENFIVVPVTVRGSVKGAIFVDNMFRSIPLTEEDIHLLTMFASEAGLALENSELYENLENTLGDLQRTQDRLIQSEKFAALGQMSAQLAHEIKNPLTVIGGFASRMLKKIAEMKADIKGQSLTNYAWVIRKEVKRLERVINQTLYFSGEKKPVFSPVNVEALLSEVLSLFREDFRDNSIRVEESFLPEKILIQADSDQLRQMFWNLITNAGQAMEEKGGVLKVSTSMVLDPFKGVEVVLSDSGGGIPQDVVRNVFNPFFTTRSSGTGLGLPIVHTIVKRHGGLINLDNRVGEGVTFQIILPENPGERLEEKGKIQLFRGGIDGFKDENNLQQGERGGKDRR